MKKKLPYKYFSISMWLIVFFIFQNTKLFTQSSCSLSYNVNNVSCFGGNNGSATVTPSGGNPPYTYQWSNGQTTQTSTGLTAGTYTINVQDGLSCNATTTITITESPAINISGNTILCFGQTTTLTASGGVSYSWSPGGQTTTSITVNPTTTTSYTVTGTDANGCTDTKTVTVNSPPTVIASKDTTICAGSSTTLTANGTIVNCSGIQALDGSNRYFRYATVYDWDCCLFSSGIYESTLDNWLVDGHFKIDFCSGKGVIIESTGGFTSSQPVGSTYIPAFGYSSDPIFKSLITDPNCCNPKGDKIFVKLTEEIHSDTIIKFNWSGPNGFTSSVQNPTITNATIAASGTYIVTATTTNGCTATDSVVITVNPSPTVNVGLDVSICSGQVTTLTASVSGGTPGYTYLWSPGNMTTTAISIQPSSSETYTITITDRNGCNTFSLLTVTVNPSPVPSFIASNSCLNNATVFTNQSIGGTQWSWNFGEPSSGPSNTSNIQNPSHTYSSAGSYSITLIVANQGCIDSISKNVFINPLPISDFSSTTLCFGNITSFTNLSNVAQGKITTWSWNFGDQNSGANNISNLQNPSHTFSSSGTFEVFLTVTSDSGCQSSIKHPAIVYPFPTASFPVTNTCLNIPFVFTDASTGAQQWYWQFGDGDTSTVQHPTHTYSGYGNYIVTLIVISPGGCTDTVANTISIYPNPVANFTSDSVCVNHPTSFTDYSSISSGNISEWKWNFGDGDTSAQQNPSHIYSSAGNHTVTLAGISNNNCINFISFPVIVYPQPTADFSSSPFPTAELTDAITFTNLSSTDVTAWYWYFGDGDSVNSNITEPTHLYVDTGIYIVTLKTISQYGCMDTVQHPIRIADFAFYVPNAFSPNKDEINDLFSGYGVGIANYEMQIFDRWGNLIFLTNNFKIKWDGTISGGSGTTVQQDVYIWKIKLTDVFNKEHKYMGNVTVIR
ncbi:MAG: PKD domain-containing protein [Bacteroidota bacterium]